MTSRRPPATVPESPPVARRGKTTDDETYLRLVGDRVRKARDALGMTRRTFSEKSGVSERYLADLEAGTGNASLLVSKRVAEALRLDIEDLLSAHPDPSADFRGVVEQLRSLSPAELASARRVIQRGLAATADYGRIALVGLRGAGKTTIGRATAEALDMPFIELDREIERAAGMELSEIFALQGKSAYRRHELDCLRTVIDQHERAVIATGGGLVTEPAAYDLLLANCFVVWLKAAPESHMDRVMSQGDLRPMADNPKAMDELRAILDSRQNLYARAHAVVDTTAATHEEVVSRLLQAVIEHRRKTSPES